MKRVKKRTTPRRKPIPDIILEKLDTIIQRLDTIENDLRELIATTEYPKEEEAKKEPTPEFFIEK
ncbi:MAG TPA: hypothetical protein VNK81_07845 [Thermodesulfobacteriota bacterium]|jgi:hypothetical protein|nr:hypothetical protein [Thermodesulfobacteriota bacterium]